MRVIYFAYATEQNNQRVYIFEYKYHIVYKDMTDKNAPLKKETISNDITILVDKKIGFFKDVIQKTIIHVQKNKFLDILGIGDVGTCIDRLGELNKKIHDVANNKNNTDNLINSLQVINNELSCLLKNYGTHSLEDLLLICFGNNKPTADDDEQDKLDLLKKYFHPTSYKVITRQEDAKQKKNEECTDEMSNLTCFEVGTSYKQFNMRVFGIKLLIRNPALKKSLLVCGTVDDVVIDFLDSKYISRKRENIILNLPQDGFQKDSFDKFLSSLILRDYLVCENESDLYARYAGHISQNNMLRQKQVSQLVREFITDDMYNKRNILINLLICSSNYENQYLAYLLYDILSNDSNGAVDTQEQTILFDSFPWTIKQYFKQAMKKTIQYTNELSNFDINKIPLEQQICLLKASDSVKEKAMMKLKEVKAKSEDSGSKARQYLDALLKIPFNVYRREPILNVMDKIKTQFKDTCRKHNICAVFPEIPNREKYTSIEVLKYIKKVQGETGSSDKNEQMDKIHTYLVAGDKKKLVANITALHLILKKYNKKCSKISTLTKEELILHVGEILTTYKELSDPESHNILNDMCAEFIGFANMNPMFSNVEIKQDVQKITDNMKQITNYMDEVKTTLDKAVHGHDKAKKQIERIIGQWLNGEQDGYCFGFEGPPGIGKTSLAKRGLSDCLKDDNGNSRPFSMIQMGGDSNGSTLHGHNYTYVGSTWGSIVQILIDKKCMNPIIFIDEVDKISRTEHGKEIVGILTHLLDPAQNDCFQDKYFTGIDLDLSKALFILSYNDVDAIDKILLDRVHRIKFNSLTLEDKLVISKTHILPEVYKKMGLEDTIVFADDVLKFIIDEYTSESGVRKLKEIMFEIVGEINLDILKNNDKDYELPINISIADIKTNYFKDKREVIIRKVPEESLVGFANGMFATSHGNGGTLPIHAKFFPSEQFLELKLTGLQQDVMRESMHVSLTVAWNLTSDERKKKVRSLYDGENNKYGINIHPGDGSVQKDGPSAGGIITIVLYSLLNDIPIKGKMAMTGEIQMSGDITAIGGLNYKILGSIKAGVKEFIYPKENKKDFEEFYEKYKNDAALTDIKFHEVSHVSEALDLILDKTATQPLLI
jgi:ATP-dependent Lon protease